MLALLAILGHFVVHSPPSIVGSYPESPIEGVSPPVYKVTAQLTLAASCPCSWFDWERPRAAELDGLALLLPDALCDETCTAQQAACAAALHNVSALLVSHRFNTQVPVAPPSPPGAAPPPPTFAVAKELLTAREAIAARGRLLGCSPGVPASMISSNMSSVLSGLTNWSEAVLGAADVLGTPAGAADMVNVTVRRREGDGSIDCAKYRSVPLVYVVAVPIWLVLTVAWTWNTYYANAASARDLHRLMCWVPVMEFVHGLLSLFNYFSCPWESILSLVYATFWSIVTILKEPILLLCLLLVAKGWCITRNYLARREVCIAGSILALLYASVSVQMSLPSPLATVPMVIMYLAMLIEISWSIWNNLRVLKAQILALRQLGVDPLTTPAHRKYLMFRRLAVCTALYAVLELIVHWVFSNGRYDEHFWLFLTLHQVMELVIASAIGYTFRAQPFNILFQQVQQVAAELADQMLPSITTIEVKPDMLQGDNLVAWRSDLGLGRPPTDPHLPPTLVVLNPGDTELPQMPVHRPALSPPPAGVTPASVAAGGLASASLAAARRAVTAGVTAGASGAASPASPSRGAPASAGARARPLAPAARSVAAGESTTAPSAADVAAGEAAAARRGAAHDECGEEE